MPGSATGACDGPDQPSPRDVKVVHYGRLNPEKALDNIRSLGRAAHRGSSEP